MSFRQMLPFLFLNVIVSTVVVLSILFWWDGRNGRGEAEAEPTSAVALVDGALPTPNLAAPPSGTVAPDVTASAAAGGPVVDGEVGHASHGLGREAGGCDERGGEHGQGLHVFSWAAAQEGGFRR